MHNMSILASAAHTHSAERPSAWDALQQLKNAGSLEKRYPEVCKLVGQLDCDARIRAGYILARIDPDEVHAMHPDVEAARIAVVGSGTVSHFVAPLASECARHRFMLRAYDGGYASLRNDLANEQSRLYAFEPDMTIAVLDESLVFDTLGALWNVEGVAAALETTFGHLRDLAETHRARCGGTLLLNTLPLSHAWLAQLVDYQSRMKLGAVWREFNARLLQMGAASERLVVVDVDAWLAETGALVDPRTRLYAKFGLGEEIVACYAREAVHVLRAVRGRTKKCLAVDLDGTLWGGVLGDVGVGGIELGGLGEGEAFARFQRVLAQVASQGVLLAICSKNDEENVRAALRDHADMKLREDDFAVIKANWEPKNVNLADIAAQLNIGADSIVFVDDNAFECGLVRELLPAVSVVHASDDPALHAHALLRDNWFSTLRLTAEDYARRDTYKANAARSELLQSSGSHEDYLLGLGTRVHLYPAVPEDTDRIAQLTQRTNQFNLTTLRFDAAGVRQWLATPRHRIWAIRSSDRFGDHGLVGAIFTSHEGEQLVIRNMLLSCRVFSRDIEKACLRALLMHAGADGLSSVKGCYRATAKNARFADFYSLHGFVGIDPDDGVSRYCHALKEIPAAVPHISLSTTLVQERELD